MKQNTKFLWMYVAILFSFALILIIFAGMSSNVKTEETQGLRNSVDKVSEENSDLHDKIKEMEKQISDITSEKEIANTRIAELEGQISSMNTEEEIETKNDEIVANAYRLYISGDRANAENVVSTIDTTVPLTPTQQYIYDIITK